MDCQINSIRIHYQIDGQPQNSPIVFINSLGCDLHIWDEVIPAFSDRFHLIRYDKRGHGLSETPPGPYTIRDHTRDLSALLNFLEIQNAALVGISVGGLIAMDYALANPSHVRLLVLCDTAPKIGNSQMWNDRIAAVHERGLKDMAETIVNRWFLPSFSQEHPIRYRQALEMLSRAPSEGYTATCAALRDADLSSSIQVIHTPTLVLCGAEDPVVTPEQAHEWAACLPSARVENIDHAAHLPCIEQPEAMANRIEHFLREVDHG